MQSFFSAVFVRLTSNARLSLNEPESEPKAA